LCWYHDPSLPLFHMSAYSPNRRTGPQGHFHAEYSAATS
jgi:hypothetical protein